MDQAVLSPTMHLLFDVRLVKAVNIRVPDLSDSYM